jgi:uncharacterized protein (DUF983 family)
VKLLDLLVGEIRSFLGREPPPDDEPRYGHSVSYAPCPACGEGSLRWDDEASANRCTACGTVVDDRDD